MKHSCPIESEKSETDLHSRSAKGSTNEGASIAASFGEIAAVALKNSRVLDEIEKSSRHWQDTFNAISDLVTVISPDHVILEINDAGCATLGLEREKIIGRKCYELIHGTDKPVKECPCQLTLKSGMPSSCSFSDKNKYYNLSAWPVKSNDGQLIAFSHIVQDITKEKESEKTIKDLSKFFSENPSPVLRFSKDGTVIYANLAAELLLNKLGSGTGAKAPEVWMKYLVETEDVPRSDHFEFSIDECTYSFRSVFIKENDYTNWYGHDITEQKKIEERLRQSEKLTSIGQLAGGVAHDFNNILGGIIGFADLTVGRLPPKHPVQKYANQIIESAERGVGLVKQLLSFARKERMNFETVNIHETIHRITVLLAHTIDPRIKLVKHLTAKTQTIMGDKSQLENAFLNLALNARDAMPNTGELSFRTYNETIGNDSQLYIVHNCRPGVYIKISVSDTGTGIDENTRKHLFEPFYTTKEQGKGVGLGLSSVYGTVIQHGGLIKLDNKRSTGTQFDIYLPVLKVPAILQTPKNDDSFVSQKSGNILFIDDDTTITNMMSEMLAELGYSVTFAADGQEAVDIFLEKSGHFNVVILDVIMPEMDGYDCFFKLKEINSDVPIIISSGYSYETKAKKLVENGAYAFVQKPYRKREFLHILANALAKKDCS